MGGHPGEGYSLQQGGMGGISTLPREPLASVSPPPKGIHPNRGAIWEHGWAGVGVGWFTVPLEPGLQGAHQDPGPHGTPKGGGEYSRERLVVVFFW